MSKLVITGGLGHIGSVILAKLSNLRDSGRGFSEIVIIDACLQRQETVFFDSNIPLRNFKLIQKVLPTDNIDDVVEVLDGADAVIHLAAVTDAPSTFERPEYTRITNVDSTKQLVNACEKVGVKKFVFASSTSIYGPSKKVNLENDACINPQTPYARSKLAAEDLVSKTDMNYATFRMGTIYGYTPGMRFHTAVNRFIWQAITKQPITIWSGAADSVRPYCHVYAACEAMLRFVSPVKDTKSGIYNIVSDHYTPNSIIEVIKQEIPNVEVITTPTRILNQDSYFAPNDKANQAGLLKQEYVGNTDHLLDYIRYIKTKFEG